MFLLYISPTQIWIDKRIPGVETIKVLTMEFSCVRFRKKQNKNKWPN